MQYYAVKRPLSVTKEKNQIRSTQNVESKAGAKSRREFGKI